MLLKAVTMLRLSVKRENVSACFDPTKIEWERYFIYSKYNSYKAFCNIEFNCCTLLYSCAVRYDDIYAFTKMPTVADVKQKK